MFGTPVITSKVGSFPEYVMNGKNGFILETKNISDYRYLLTLIHEVQNKLARMSLNARETFKRTFWYKAYVAKVKNLLAKITS
jgi:glycosyltransferase involved in cell wall biosynthesis